MTNATLKDLFHDGLRDIFYAERKILKALPNMIEAAQSDELRTGFQKHLAETEDQVERLQQVFKLIGKPAEGKTCPAIDGIIEEGEEIMKNFKGKVALDAGLLAAAQAVEHYEIARYGTLRSWAQCLELSDAVTLLDETLREEEATDETLSALADASINEAAMADAA